MEIHRGNSVYPRQCGTALRKYVRKAGLNFSLVLNRDVAIPEKYRYSYKVSVRYCYNTSLTE